jgi:hypothetical protein
MEAALKFLAGSPISLSSIFVTLFKQPTYNHHICLHDIHNNLHTILNTLLHNPSTCEEVLSWTKCVTAEIYCKELTALTDDETLHIVAIRYPPPIFSSHNSGSVVSISMSRHLVGGQYVSLNKPRACHGSSGQKEVERAGTVDDDATAFDLPSGVCCVMLRSVSG